MSQQDSVILTRERFNDFVRNHLDHADQARDYWQRYIKAEFAMLSIADEIERDNKNSDLANRIRAVFNDLKIVKIR